MAKRFPSYIQFDITDCGPTCLRIISKYYGKEFSLDFIRKLSEKTRIGTNLLTLSEAAEKIGYNTLGARISYEVMEKEAIFPCIVFWKQDHFLVVYKIKKDKVYVSDPAQGLVVMSKKEFLSGWAGNSEDQEGIVLLLEPTEAFFKNKNSRIKETHPLVAFKRVFGHLLKYKKLFVQVFIGLFCGSLISLAFPFLFQAMIDVGISNQNLDFIYIILLAQIFLFAGSVSIELLRRVILMHISSRVNIQLLGDFIKKMFSLPISFFDAKLTGDILQRIGDHQRVESFFTSGTLNILFSMVNLVVFAIVLIYYDALIFLIFGLGSLLFFYWIKHFLRQRAEYDFKRFNQQAENSEKTLELINGMQAIKLNNNEIRKRWEWEYLQAKLFKINLEGLRIDNFQNGGASLLNELKNIVITFYAATLVLNGELTLGMMLSISYIIGQMNVPLSQLLHFMQTYQDAKLSMERINDVYLKEEEETEKHPQKAIPEDRDIRIQDLFFRYKGTRKDNFVLRGINLHIPKNQITAIVGASGSGKTTLLKLLLKFYEPSEGSILVGDTDLNLLSHKKWRRKVGTVMQDGFLFPDSIAENIAIGDQSVDADRLVRAAKIACIHDFIVSLPLGYDTKIGAAGVPVSVGQKQRILIARAVYKNPDYLFFDEATSALDAKNEKNITENLDHFFQGRTAVIIAHRLSTVKNADQILVLDEGQISEMGTHEELVQQRGLYFNLVKNQLEVGV